MGVYVKNVLEHYGKPEDTRCCHQRYFYFIRYFHFLGHVSALASLLLRSGLSGKEAYLRRLQLVLGHYSINTTAVYAKLNNQDLQEVRIIRSVVVP
jgi:integrase